MSLFKGNKEKKEKFAHIIASMIILIHAWEKQELKEPYAFFLVAGIVFLIIALLHHRPATIFPYIDGVFFIIEAIVYAVITADYFTHGKKALP